MKSNKYTLDRLEGEFAVFLKYPTETESILVPCAEMKEPLNEGDIVSISILHETYKIELLENETMKQKDNVQSLLEKLKNNQE